MLFYNPAASFFENDSEATLSIKIVFDSTQNFFDDAEKILHHP